jgi:formiminotetrahydrofolate cyclodeaminase
MFKDLTVKDFIAELASNSPAPGGGSTAAFAASLGSALSSMVFNLTVGKKAFNELSDEIKELIVKELKEAQESKEEFLSLMDKDTEAFMILMASFKLPKETEDEKSVRSSKIQEAYKGATEVPLEMAVKAYKIYDYIMTACTYGNKNAISDAGVAALMTQSSIEAAVLNVRINLSSIKDEDYKQRVKKQCEELVANGAKKKEEILSIVDLEIGC